MFDKCILTPIPHPLFPIPYWFGFHYPELPKKSVSTVSIGGDLFDRGARMIGEPQAGLKNKCEEILMNWKTLLVITSLTLSAGLTACNKEAATPDATKPAESTAPAASEAPKGDAPKSDAKPAEGKGDAMKPAEGKGDAMKPADTKGDKKPEATKKP
jgi:hypothetical protein